MSSSSPTKKRKANDGRATASDDTNHDHLQINGGGGGSGTLSSWLGYYFSGRQDISAPPPASCNDNLSQKMDRMEQIMLRMEEKCNRLEAKCSSLENILEMNSQLMKEHVDSKIDSLDAKIDQKFKQHEYNDMIQKNQSWKYSAPVHSKDELIDAGFEINCADYLSKASDVLREATEKMRSGEFPDEEYVYRHEKGITLEIGSGYDEFVNEYLLPYWREFAAALKEFNPAFGVLPDGFTTFFNMYHVKLNNDAMLLLKDALINKPFLSLSFENEIDEDGEYVGGMSVNAIMDIMDSNKHLRHLHIKNNPIARDHIGKICSAVHNYSLIKLSLDHCFEDGLGDEMMTSLLTSDGLNLERLSMVSNGITSNVTTLLSDFLATNPPLKEINFWRNHFNDDDAVVIANALRSNTTLKDLDLELNSITNAAAETFRLVLHDDRSLNSISDSNHSCSVRLESGYYRWNRNCSFYERVKNRGRKIYTLLSLRNKALSNIQHFGDIDVKVLPNMIEAVQRYANMYDWSYNGVSIENVKPLSILYEVMRKWEEVFPLYELTEHN